LRWLAVDPKAEAYATYILTALFVSLGWERNRRVGDGDGGEVALQ